MNKTAKILLALLFPVTGFAQIDYGLPSPEALLQMDHTRAANLNHEYEVLDPTVYPAPEGCRQLFTVTVKRNSDPVEHGAIDPGLPEKELIARWKKDNADIFHRWCISKENKGSFAAERIPILKSIVEDIDKGLATAGPSDSILELPVADFQAVMALIGAYGNHYNGTERACNEHFAAFASACKDARFQFILFRDDKGKAWVKMVHNGREVGIPTIAATNRAHYEWEVLREYITYRMGGGYKVPPLTASVIRKHILDRDDTRLRLAGRLAAPRVGTKNNPFWSIDCCTLDRDYADFEQYRPYLPELGAGYARIVSGWNKTEKVRSSYSFEWLDTIVDGIIDAGLTPWITLGYGNSLYQKSGTGLGSEIFTDEETLQAWERYVAAVVRRYKGKVSMYEVWNEPDFGGTMRRAIPYANLFARTAAAIRGNDPDVKIAGLSLGGGESKEFAKAALDGIKERGALGYMDYLAFHPYSPFPESRKDSIISLVEFIKTQAPDVKVLEGEVGVISDLYVRNQQEGSEYTQAKWVLRQMAMEFGLNIPCSIFSIIDNLYPDRLQSYGMIRADCARKAVYKRPAFYAYGNMAAVLHDGFSSDGDLAVKTRSPKKLACVSVLEGGRKVGALLWFCGEKPSDDLKKDRLKIIIEGLNLSDPVYADPITGRVFELPRFRNTRKGLKLKKLPVWDSPVFIIERASLRLDAAGAPAAGTLSLPGDEKIDEYTALFNASDEELYVNDIPNKDAAAFLKANIPVFDCPDKELEKTYYFRWWTYRKHIRKTADGYVVTEFLPNVPWAGKHNTISCPAAHHIREGRWLRDKSIIAQYCRVWFFGGGNPRLYSFPAADAILQQYKLTGDREWLASLYEALCANYAAWSADHRDSTGLFWQIDDRDGMEMSVAGLLSSDYTGYRPTINSYAFADARALAETASILGREEDAGKWSDEAGRLRTLINETLWDSADKFYKVVPRYRDMSVAPTREEIGFIPWMYGIADETKGVAWRQLFDTLGFKAPYGPTVTERRDPGFKLAYEGHECQWNGPSWPYATAQTLTAMIECLRTFGEKFFSKEEFFEVLQTYSDSHRIADGDGVRRRCWIDENINPFTGDWLSRTILIDQGRKIPERGKDYNHSSFCDLVISGIIGLNPSADGSVTIQPLLPEGKWDWFCLKGVCIGNSVYDVVFDKDGTHYGGPKGLCVYRNGKLAARSRKYSTSIKI